MHIRIIRFCLSTKLVGVNFSLGFPLAFRGRFSLEPAAVATTARTRGEFEPFRFFDQTDLKSMSALYPRHLGELVKNRGEDWRGLQSIGSGLNHRGAGL